MAPPRQDLLVRFWAKVDRRSDDACWPWLRSTDDDGYGRFWFDTRNVRAHRLVYELAVGPIPNGLTIDHLCRNPTCVNPKHLEPVTNKENILRGESASAQNARKTHCKRGHEFTPENTYLRLGGGYRRCRTCRARWVADRARQAQS